MSARRSSPLLFVLNNAPVILFVLVVLVFSALSPRFLNPENLLNILIQSSATVIVATGMTFVLLTAGVDLSVGAAMVVAAAVAGKMLIAGQPLPLAIGIMVLVGAVFGIVNAFFITRLKIVPFIVTLAMLFIGRGLALWITETRAMNLPESFLQLGSARVLGIPMPVLLAGAVVLIANMVLRSTPFGRQIYAVGNNAESARKAGIRVQRITAGVYIACSVCAVLGAVITLGQLGSVSPKFGENYEFKAIAAAVLGGTSLFGGRGTVLPGTLLGAVLIQSVEAGLVIVNPDPYLYPLVTSGVIFIAVLVDSTRSRMLARLHRRPIYVEHQTA